MIRRQVLTVGDAPGVGVELGEVEVLVFSAEEGDEGRECGEGEEGWAGIVLHVGQWSIVHCQLLIVGFYFLVGLVRPSFWLLPGFERLPWSLVWVIHFSTSVRRRFRAAWWVGLSEVARLWIS